MFDDYTEAQRTRSQPFRTFKMDSIEVELPFICPICGAPIRKREQLGAFKGYDKERAYIEHLAPGCVFEPKQIRVLDVPEIPGQTTINDMDEGGGEGEIEGS